MDDGNNDKKAKGTKNSLIKRIFKFNDYRNCLLDNEIIAKSQQRFKSEAHNVYTQEIIMELRNIYMVQVLEKYSKQSC